MLTAAQQRAGRLRRMVALSLALHQAIPLLLLVHRFLGPGRI
jgi:hypothetical protein